MSLLYDGSPELLPPANGSHSGDTLWPSRRPDTVTAITPEPSGSPSRFRACGGRLPRVSISFPHTDFAHELPRPRVVVAKAYGVRRLGEPAPVDAATRFGIASNTKLFTATALALFVGERSRPRRG